MSLPALNQLLSLKLHLLRQYACAKSEHFKAQLGSILQGNPLTRCAIRFTSRHSRSRALHPNKPHSPKLKMLVQTLQNEIIFIAGWKPVLPGVVSCWTACRVPSLLCDGDLLACLEGMEPQVAFWCSRMSDTCKIKTLQQKQAWSGWEGMSLTIQRANLESITSSSSGKDFETGVWNLTFAVKGVMQRIRLAHIPRYKRHP